MKQVIIKLTNPNGMPNVANTNAIPMPLSLPCLGIYPENFVSGNWEIVT